MVLNGIFNGFLLLSGVAVYCSSTGQCDGMGDHNFAVTFVDFVASLTGTGTVFTAVEPSTAGDEDASENDRKNKIDVGLNEVPETMLWTLHNRAGEAMKGTWGPDDKCVEIYQSINYNYERSFGPSDESHALRSELFDELVLDFWKKNPDGSTVINLAEGLETQRYRLEEQREKHNSLWVTVDLPEAIKARERFIKPDKNHLHLSYSALDVDKWVGKLPKSHRDKPVFITAQGLLMYFEPEENARMLASLAEKFPGATVAFDFLSKFLSDLSLSESGWKKTPHYTVPRMPTGANRHDCEALFEGWVPGATVDYIPWPFEKSSNFGMRNIVSLLVHVPYLNNYQPGHVWAVTFPPASGSSDLKSEL